MATVQRPPEQRLVLDSVPWESYTRVLRALSDRPGVRLTYDRGTLELMTLSHEDEGLGYFLARLVDSLTEELGLPVKGGGSTTFRRRKRQRGLEPDACWWIANEHLVRGKKRIDLRVDPPPDLALEVDITHSSLNRLAIYAVLRIPEVWRLENQKIACHVLALDGRYQISQTSRAFPTLAPMDLAQFLVLLGQLDENAIVRQFRTWVRQHVLPNASNP